MINSELNKNGLGSSGTGKPTYNKQPAVAIKKIALRDVQNDNRSLIRNHQESSPFVERRPISDAIKVCGIKRLTPECPSSPPCHPSLSNNGPNEHLMYAGKKIDSELGKGRIQDNTNKDAGCFQSRQFFHKQQEIPQKQTLMRESNMHRVPVVAPNHMASMMKNSYGASSVPSSLGKPENGSPAAESNCLKVSSVVPHSIDSKGADVQQRSERFIHLQKFLKHCDESDQRDYIQMLLHLSPAELSTHAVELEKKAIQLTVEEGKEMQRMKALNVLGKSGPTDNPLQTTQPLQFKK